MDPAHGSLVALWDFRHTGGDDLCNNHPGTIVGEPWCVAGPKPGTKALEFDGASYVSVEGSPEFDITEQITVAAWIKVNAFDREWQSVVTKGDSSWRLARTAVENNMCFHVTGITSENNGRHNNLGVEGNISVADGQWHHVVAVYDGSSVSLYVDGALDKSLAAKGKIATNTYKVMIGENSERTGRGWKGMIGEVAIFNHAMKPAEIEDLCKNGANDSPREGHADEVARQAEAEIKDMTPPQAIPHLRNKIAEYRKWLATQGENVARRDRTPPPDLYVLLGRQMEAAGMPKDQVAAVYERAFRNVYTNTRHLPAAFSWLVANMPMEYSESIIRDVASTDAVPYSLVYGITAQLAKEKNWPAIETFLNAMFAEIEDPLTRAAAVDWALRDTVGNSDEFTRYCRGRPGLTRYIFRTKRKRRSTMRPAATSNPPRRYTPTSSNAASPTTTGPTMPSRSVRPSSAAASTSRRWRPSTGSSASTSPGTDPCSSRSPCSKAAAT